MYDRVLEGLHLVARHAASYLLDQVLSWRRDSLNVAARLSPEVLVLRKRVSTPSCLALGLKYVQQQACIIATAGYIA